MRSLGWRQKGTLKKCYVYYITMPSYSKQLGPQWQILPSVNDKKEKTISLKASNGTKSQH